MRLGKFIKQFSLFSKNGLCFLRFSKRAEFSKILVQNFYIIMYCQRALACFCECVWVYVCLGVFVFGCV